MTLHTAPATVISVIASSPSAASDGMSSFTQSLVTLVVGFVLTTVAGTILAALVQQRTWSHQWAMQRNKEDQAQAQAAFDQVSGIMDRRLFWVTQLHLWTRRGDDERLRNALKNYRNVLKDWNEAINRQLAMLEIFFGTDVREGLDRGVGAEFVVVGAGVEALYRDRPAIDDQPIVELTDAIEHLRLQVYAFNLQMLRRIDERYRHPSPPPKSSVLLRLIRSPGNVYRRSRKRA